MKTHSVLRLLLAILLLPVIVKSQRNNTITGSSFKLTTKEYGIDGLWKIGDAYPTNYINKNKLLGEIIIRFRSKKGTIDSITGPFTKLTSFRKNGKQTAYKSAATGKKALELTQSLELKNERLNWQLNIRNTSQQPLLVEDVAIPFFYNRQGGENPQEIFEQQVIKHHFISGNNSYMFWERPTGVGPYLVMTPNTNTSLEYFSTGRYGKTQQVFQAYIHSAYTGGNDTLGTWRQQHTSVTIPANTTLTYGFTFQWANDYGGIRNILVSEGLIDVHVAPGMTVPNDLMANFALRTKASIDKIVAEFPNSTTISYEGEKPAGTYLYKVRFRKLGENMLTITYNGNKKTYLEFFSTEPLDILFKKRAAFLVSHQQHTDSTKWYNGLFSEWDMKNQVLRGPDNTDGFDGWWGYVLSCDDPGLSKAPFLAAKNVVYPNQKEIAGIEYYIKNFVWGKLQRTDTESPYPYGIYGTPNWLANRDTATRMKNLKDTNRAKMHIWRSYDYPHLMMLYYHMYQIATLYPDMVTFADKNRYLQMAKETAKAYFIYPYEILPWYETYKWGCYNELLLTDLMKVLVKEGYKSDADWLRKEWEKKVKYFIYDDPYPFRSEYAVDATAFESSQALAAYGVENEMQPDSNLWYDKNKAKWYSHPVVSKDSARRFMDRQIQANIALRGWLEPTYYHYGSDFRGRSDFYNLSYMSQMGGWAILDYALRFAQYPSDYIRLGYASYLSSFALMNTGDSSSNYGFWYPGKQNDGASGWAFEPAQHSTNWIRKEQGRGPWVYDGEIDLGYGGATRAAATIVANDPVFGPMAFGGELSQQKNTYYIVPKDGLRTRLFYRLDSLNLNIEFERDGFAKDQSIAFAPTENKLVFTVENRTSDKHQASFSISGLPAAAYNLLANGQVIKTYQLGEAPVEIQLPMDGSSQQQFEISQVKKL